MAVVSLNQAIEEALEDGANLDNVGDRVISEHGLEIIRPYAERLIRDRARHIVSRFRSKTLFAVSGDDEGATEQTVVDAAERFWNVPWSVIRGDRYCLIPTRDLTLDDCLFLRQSHIRIAQQNIRRASLFKGLVEELGRTGARTVGDLRNHLGEDEITALMEPAA